MSIFLGGLHVLVALAAALLVGWLGRAVAWRLRQPSVVGEIVAGLLAGPVLVALLGKATFQVVLPQHVTSAIGLVAECALALFLVGVTHELRLGDIRSIRTPLAYVFAGAFAFPLAAGALLAAWIVVSDRSALRGTAPTAAFVVYLMVALAITAVPVLARILADRGASGTVVGRLALGSAVVMDVAGWLLLSVAVALRSGSLTGFVRTAIVLVAGVLLALVLRRVLHAEFAGRLAARRPVGAAIALGVLAIAVAQTFEHLGLTAIFGAILVGMAVPVATRRSWAAVVSSVTKAGRGLVPVFFVATGLTVFVTGAAPVDWTALVLIVVLGLVGKVAGGYFGARAGGQSPATAARVGVLVNTRGLTELVVLKVGLQAGILNSPLFLALVVMAVLTTVATGPLLLLLDRVLPEQEPSRDHRS